ncbi:MAG: lysylphosphatidylglycerol synthase transmembrane domain-containing protein [Boseongicola sp.]|nr:lysylphosphatidylglycerol synthase transmembrane domain-containing protein [Boseongicola sp.]
MTLSSPKRSTASTSAAQRRRDSLLLFGLLGLVAIGLGGLIAATGWRETLEGLKKITLLQFAVLLALSLVNYGFRALRWHLFAAKLGLPTTLKQNSLHFLGGFAMSVTPGRVGELVRMRWIRRQTGWAFEKTAPLAIVDRAADLAAMAVLLALAIALSATGIAGAVPIAILALMSAYIVTRPVLLRSVSDGFFRATGKRFSRTFARIRRAARSLDAFQSSNVLMSAGALGVIGWFAEGLAFWLLLQWMGADIGLWLAIAIFVFATLAGGLTGAPGGLGGAEAAMVALLALNGVSLHIALPATLIIRVTTLWFAIGIGLILFPIAEKQSNRAGNDLENT